jgi:hypothetical protein
LPTGSTTVQVPAAQGLAFCTLPIFGRAPERSGEPYREGIAILGSELVAFGRANLGELAQTHGARGLTEVHQPHIEDFARLLGKIGYCVAVASFGIDAVKDSPLVGAILGKREDIGRWVGSTEWQSKSAEFGATHAVATLVETRAHKRQLTVLVNLFANAHTTAYEIAVGHLRDLAVPRGGAEVES